MYPMKFGKPRTEPTALTFTPIVHGVRRAAGPHWAYWSILKAGRYHAFRQIIPNGEMRPLGTCKTLQDAEDACRHHHAVGVGEVAA